jgi:hypothetical protein
MGLGFKISISLWRELCGYLLIKISFVSSIELLSWNIGTGCLIGTSQNGTIYIDSHSKFVIETQYIM